MPAEVLCLTSLEFAGSKTAWTPSRGLLSLEDVSGSVGHGSRTFSVGLGVNHLQHPGADVPAEIGAAIQPSGKSHAGVSSVKDIRAQPAWKTCPLSASRPVHGANSLRYTDLPRCPATGAWLLASERWSRHRCRQEGSARGS